jgi:hypothetical protein
LPSRRLGIGCGDPLHDGRRLLPRDWLLSLQGYQSGSEVSAPLGTAVLAGIPAVLLMVAPTIPAMIFGFRARAQGVTSGIIPAAIGAVVAAGAILTNGLPLLLGIR